MKAIVVLLMAASAMLAQTGSDVPRYTPDGQLLLADNYREWIYLSSGLGMTYGPANQANRASPAFENVFASRAAYKAFLESGKWPDKTVLILEIRRSAEKGSINNAGHYQTDVLSVEAAVKDEQRFPQKWAYFGFGRENRSTPFPATSACNSCHGRNAAVENTFVQFYPTLFEVATKKGTLNPTWSSAQPEDHR